MMRQKRAMTRKEARPPRMDGADALGNLDQARLGLILQRGFGVAKGYGDMSRDRHHITLEKGVGNKELFDFCSSHLKGSPMPGSDPIRDGPRLLDMFRSAERAGLVRLTYVKADRFVPERGRG